MTLRAQRNPKRDANEKDIKEALERVGAFVTPLSAEGCPDLLVIYHGEKYLLEVKMPKGKLTPAQTVWHATALNHNVGVHIVHSPLEALTAIGAID